MEILKIIIENFKGIERVELGPIKPINVLIGRNNCGKTSILEAIEVVSGYWQDQHGVVGLQVPVEFCRCIKGDESKPFAITFSINMSVEERTQIFRSIFGTILEEHISLYLDKNLFEETYFCFSYVNAYNRCYLTRIDTRFDGKTKTLMNLLIKDREDVKLGYCCTSIINLFMSPCHTSDDFNTRLDNINQKQQQIIVLSLNLTPIRSESPLDQSGEMCLKLISNAWSFLKETFSSLSIVPAIRKSNEYSNLGNDKPLDPSGSHLVPVINYLQMNKKRQFRRIVTFIKKLLPEAGDVHIRQTQQAQQIELAFELDEDIVIRLMDMGGAAEQLLILACFLIEPIASPCWVGQETRGTI